MEYDKPFKTYDELVLLLKSRNLAINTTDAARKILSTVSYYDLVNGYKEFFMINDRFIEDMTIEYLYSLYHFDISFQNILIKYSFYVERIFKNNLAYVIAANYGEDHKQYLNPQNYQNKSRKKYGTFCQTFEDLNYICDSKNNYMRDPTLHYFKNKNHIPPWILFKNVNFGDCIHLYSFLKPTEKDEICDVIIGIRIKDASMRKDILHKGLNIVRKFRNVIAHNLKFITFKCSKKDSLFLKSLTPVFGNSLINKKLDFQEKRGFNDAYSMILSIIILLKDESLIKSFLDEIIDFLQRTKNSSGIDMTPLVKRYLAITNMPSDLSARLETYRSGLDMKKP